MSDIFFDSYTANTGGVSVIVRRVSGKFVVTVVHNTNRKIPPVNAADDNLARAVAWAIDSYATHALRDARK